MQTNTSGQSPSDRPGAVLVGRPNDAVVLHEASRKDSVVPKARGRVNDVKARSTLVHIGLGLVVTLVVVGVWVLVTGIHAVAPVIIPSPAGLWASAVAMGPEIPSSIGYSVVMTLSGFTIGIVAGILLGLSLAFSATARELFGKLLDFTRPVPVFVLIPLFTLWFGIGLTPQIVLIALGTSLIMGVTTTEAVRNVPSIYVKAALSLGASRTEVYRTVVLPSILPHLAGALRVAAAASWGLDVAAEMIGAQTGLGHLLIVRQAYLDTGGLIDIAIIYAALAIVLDTFLARSARRLFRWSERGERGGVVSVLLGR